MRTRYEKEVTPELWNDLLLSYKEDDHTPEDFLNETNRIARDVIDEYVAENKIQTADDFQLESWAEDLWEESQSFWSEISDVIERNINFVSKLTDSAKKEIHGLFPQSDKTFGEKATQLLIDLAFQANLYSYTKITKPYLVDMRRMVNISGQIVEEILSHKIFGREMIIGEIYRLLDSFNKESSPEKLSFFKRFPNGKLLLSKHFLTNLKIVWKARDPYSHGASPDQKIDDDFPNCVRALIDKNTGVLPTLYKLLNDTKPT
ncbi:MAG TPA: hypothetical protein VNI77_12275 [Nitrososphaera sp.]|nr:hypothetical protein [Nitrososphaera sp.]